MKRSRGLAWIGGAAAIAVVLVAVFLYRSGGVETRPSSTRDVDGDRISKIPAVETRHDLSETEAQEDSPSEAEDAEETMTAEERAEAAEEKLVDTFDALTDKWMESSDKGVTMEDVNAFVSQFATVPKDRKEECLQRALNLIPDENVMLLVGVLMDKTQDKELIELVFNDILNREEDVKKPILQQILKDKTHPCWSDAAWLLDVQEPELPNE